MSSSHHHTISLDEDRRRIDVWRALEKANTTEEVIDLIPLGYRSILREPLLEVASDTASLCEATSTLNSWEAHLAAGLYPAHCKPVSPKDKIYCDDLLANSIRIKTDQVNFIRNSLLPEQLFDRLAPLIHNFFISLPSDSSHFAPVNDFVTITLSRSVYENLMSCCHMYGARVRSIVENHHR
jgi:hypothetical protein